MARFKGKKTVRGNEWMLSPKAAAVESDIGDSAASVRETPAEGKPENTSPSISPIPAEEFEPLRLVAIEKDSSGMRHYHIIEWVPDDSNLSCPRFSSQVSRVKAEKSLGYPGI